MTFMFSPTKIGTLTLKNRIIMAPMQQRQGTEDGYATDYHIHHYGERARGGVGAVIIESTTVSENGRLFPDDIGIFADQHIPPLKKVVEACHKYDTPVIIQLCHGGRKSHPEENRKLWAPSTIAFDDFYGEPKEMTIEDIRQVIQAFQDAAKRSLEAGFDGIELHAAHGYLLHQFLSPLSNQRTDEYGGSLGNRLRLIREVLTAVRKVVGGKFPVQIRVSATDYFEGGLQPDEVGEAISRLIPLGLDAVHVSSGGLLPVQPPEVYPGYQVPYAESIKGFVSIPVIAVGLIHSADLAENILKQGKADLIAIGRPLLEEPDFVRKWQLETVGKK
jgi:NADPH2 dehydrogenase